MSNLCEYTLTLVEDAVHYEESVGLAKRVVDLYSATAAAQSDEGKYRTVILESPFGLTLLWSNGKHDVPRINLSYRDGAECAFPTNGDRCILPLAMLLVLGDNLAAGISLKFSGDMPSEEVLTAAAKLALKVVSDLPCPIWFPKAVFDELFRYSIAVPDHLDFRP